MSNYDSILKEKKTYEEVVVDKGPKPFPWLKIDLLCLCLILIISYFIYNKKVLAPDKIFLNDLKILTDRYQNIFAPLELELITDGVYNLRGTINLNDEDYKFELNKNGEKINLNFNDDLLNYYSVANQRYLKLSNFDDNYYQLTDGDYLNMLFNLKKYLSSDLPKEKFIKRIYMNDTIPIVESNLILDSDEIKDALSLSLLDNSYEMLFTFKNHALTNEVISMKITINNLTTHNRQVILYENNILTYRDNEKIFKLEFIEKNRNFRLNIYKNDSDTPYSVLEGRQEDGGYLYTYNIIDKGYSINFNVKKEDNLTIYSMTSIVEKDDNIYNNNLVVSFEKYDETIFEIVDISNSLKYDSLTEQEQEQYQVSLNNIIGSLKFFIEQH